VSLLLLRLLLHRQVLGAEHLSRCLIRRLLLFKYRKHLKSLDLTDNEIADTFKRLAPPDGTAMAPELFHAAIMRDLDVVLTTGVRRAGCLLIFASEFNAPGIDNDCVRRNLHSSWTLWTRTRTEW
jgi:hypothetical protein